MIGHTSGRPGRCRYRAAVPDRQMLAGALPVLAAPPDGGDAREWFIFADPDDIEHEVRADLSWLMSTWTCIFGRGCLGINADRPGDACCTHGAYYVDVADERRVRAAVKELTPELWERHGTRVQAVTDELDGEPARKTRVVEGVCVYFNRGPENYGCALHSLAVQTGRNPMDTKPYVCWQVPLRREWEDLGEGRSLTVVSEFSRDAWGDGGAELSWWCTRSALAHAGGAVPVYRTYEPELRELLGDPAYDLLRDVCDRRWTQGGTVVPLPLVER